MDPPPRPALDRFRIRVAVYENCSEAAPKWTFLIAKTSEFDLPNETVREFRDAAIRRFRDIYTHEPLFQVDKSQDSYGSDLFLGDRVGDIFADNEIFRIVKGASVRDSLQPYREASLQPAISRYRKRSPGSPDSPEERRAGKRQRTHDPDRPLRSRELETYYESAQGRDLSPHSTIQNSQLSEIDQPNGVIRPSVQRELHNTLDIRKTGRSSPVLGEPVSASQQTQANKIRDLRATVRRSSTVLPNPSPKIASQEPIPSPATIRNSMKHPETTSTKVATPTSSKALQNRYASNKKRSRSDPIEDQSEQEPQSRLQGVVDPYEDVETDLEQPISSIKRRGVTNFNQGNGNLTGASQFKPLRSAKTNGQNGTVQNSNLAKKPILPNTRHSIGGISVNGIVRSDPLRPASSPAVKRLEAPDSEEEEESEYNDESQRAEAVEVERLRLEKEEERRQHEENRRIESLKQEKLRQEELEKKLIAEKKEQERLTEEKENARLAAEADKKLIEGEEKAKIRAAAEKKHLEEKRLKEAEKQRLEEEKQENIRKSKAAEAAHKEAMQKKKQEEDARKEAEKKKRDEEAEAKEREKEKQISEAAQKQQADVAQIREAATAKKKLDDEKKAAETQKTEDVEEKQSAREGSMQKTPSRTPKGMLERAVVAEVPKLADSPMLPPLPSSDSTRKSRSAILPPKSSVRSSSVAKDLTDGAHKGRRVSFQDTPTSLSNGAKPSILPTSKPSASPAPAGPRVPTVNGIKKVQSESRQTTIVPGTFPAKAATPKPSTPSSSQSAPTKHQTMLSSKTTPTKKSSTDYSRSPGTPDAPVEISSDETSSSESESERDDESVEAKNKSQVPIQNSKLNSSQPQVKKTQNGQGQQAKPTESASDSSSRSETRDSRSPIVFHTVHKASLAAPTQPHGLSRRTQTPVKKEYSSEDASSEEPDEEESEPEIPFPKNKMSQLLSSQSGGTRSILPRQLSQNKSSSSNTPKQASQKPPGTQDEDYNQQQIDDQITNETLSSSSPVRRQKYIDEPPSSALLQPSQSRFMSSTPILPPSTKSYGSRPSLARYAAEATQDRLAKLKHAELQGIAKQKALSDARNGGTQQPESSESEFEDSSSDSDSNSSDGDEVPNINVRATQKSDEIITTPQNSDIFRRSLAAEIAPFASSQGSISTPRKSSSTSGSTEKKPKPRKSGTEFGRLKARFSMSGSQV